MKHFLKHPFSVVSGIVLVSLFFLMIFSAPHDFPINRVVEITGGETLQEISTALKEENVIRWRGVFSLGMRITDGDRHIQAGAYMFEERLSVFRLGWRLVRGEHGLERVRVRLPEGATRHEMAEILEREIKDFDEATFLKLTENKEGYLFPDTYFFPEYVNARIVVYELEEAFKEKTKELREVSRKKDISFDDVVIMASIIEREAYDYEDRRLISGVLWNRIAIDMPLQVDAPFVVLIGKGSSELTREDLATTSPYNTYVHRGLPPGPIGSSSLDALDAALNPTDSEYFFYLSDEDGVTHFAEDFEEHKRNRALHL